MIVALVGQPNCGKSTIFSAIAGIAVRTGNFPGTTVSYSEAEVIHKGRKIRVVDLPGTYSLHATDAAEKVTLEYLLSKKVDVIVNVIDASVLSRSLELTIELAELRIPMVIVLNMMDEARRKGVIIDSKCLEKVFEVPVIETVAHRGIGLETLLEKLLEARIPKIPRYSREVEGILAKWEGKAGRRELVLSLHSEGFEEFKQDISKLGDPFEVLSDERHKLAMRIFESCAKVTERQRDWRDYVDSFLLHPVYGFVVMFFVFLTMLSVAFFVGSLISEIFEPLAEIEFGDGLYGAILNGIWQGFVGIVGIVVPYMLPLLLILGFLEDTGYLARAAFLLDRFFHAFGLHGKAAAQFLLGYGCSVPAVMATRILEDPLDRLKAAILVPMIPCSARSVIILSVIAGIFGPAYALAFYLLNLAIVAVAGIMLMKLLGSMGYGLVMEVPSFKVPSLRIIWLKIAVIVKEFILYASPIIILGSALFSILSFYQIDSVFNDALSPLTSLLGLPAALGFTLIFGILRKELALLMTFQALSVTQASELSAMLTKCQIMTYVLFLTLYVPCLSTLAVMVKELGVKNTIFAVAFNLLVATSASLLFRLLCIYSGL